MKRTVLLTIFLTILCFGCGGVEVYQVKDTNIEKTGKRFRTNIALKLDELTKEENISIYVHISDVNITTFSTPLEKQRIENLEQGIRNELSNSMERDLLSRPGRKITLVDRSHVKTVLTEYELSQIGLLNDEIRLKIGNLLGINYIIDSSFSRHFRSHYDYTDVISMKLIELSTVKVLAVDTVNRFFNYSHWKRTWDLVSYEVDGKKVVIGGDDKLYLKE